MTHSCNREADGHAPVPTHRLAAFAIALPMPGIRKGHVMSKRENDANNVFRPSDSPLTEYEKEQIVLRKNLERLKAERLAREAANSKND